MNAAEDDKRSSFPGDLSDRVPAKSIAGMNANPDHIARLDSKGIQTFKSFVTDFGVAEGAGCGCSEHIEPTWSDHRGAESGVTRVHEMYFQKIPLGLLRGGIGFG